MRTGVSTFLGATSLLCCSSVCFQGTSNTTNLTPFCPCGHITPFFAPLASFAVDFCVKFWHSSPFFSHITPSLPLWFSPRCLHYVKGLHSFRLPFQRKKTNTSRRVTHSTGTAKCKSLDFSPSYIRGGLSNFPT